MQERAGVVVFRRCFVRVLFEVVDVGEFADFGPVEECFGEWYVVVFADGLVVAFLCAVFEEDAVRVSCFDRVGEDVCDESGFVSAYGRVSDEFGAVGEVCGVCWVSQGEAHRVV